MVLKNAGQGNDARIRAKVDNAVTFPHRWKKQGPDIRGLSPDIQSGARIAAQMNTGDLVPVNPDDVSEGYLASNIRFNPKTKQVFAALNYGRREHGSTTFYGHSFLILKSHLKHQAQYYPLDTFLSYEGGARADAQFPYQRLAAMIGAFDHNEWLAHSKSMLLEEIMQSCYHGRVRDDSAAMTDLVEAHIFSEVTFRDHVEALVLSPTTAKAEYKAIPFSTIVANAKTFANKHGIKLYQVS